MKPCEENEYSHTQTCIISVQCFLKSCSMHMEMRKAAHVLLFFVLVDTLQSYVHKSVGALLSACLTAHNFGIGGERSKAPITMQFCSPQLPKELCR